MKSSGEIMEILEAYDLTGSYRTAAELAGCSHHTVFRYVALREHGTGPKEGQSSRQRLIDPYLPKIEELVERSGGKVRADVVHGKLEAMGHEGSQRTTRRAVAAAKGAFAEGRRRLYRPWVTEPGMWMQWDFGEGPRVHGRRTYLFCAWLAWSRYRVVYPIWDRSLPTVIGCLDAAVRKFGGVPTYALTDNEKTVTITHVAGLPVRNQQMVEAARHYGITVATCVPADPESKGGSEATVRIAKADLVPTEANLRPGYEGFAELKEACQSWCEEVNERPHRQTRKPPAMLLAQEKARLHPVPDTPFTAAFGQTRRVGWDSTVSFEGARYSVPHTLVDRRVWVRCSADEVVAVHADPARGPVEVARHAVRTPGNPSIADEHYPPAPPGALEREPRPKSVEEEAFLSIGDGAKLWLVEAAAAGTHKIRFKMERALGLSKLHGREVVDEALEVSATSGRFGEEDLASILAYRSTHPEHNGHQDTDTVLLQADAHTLQRGTASWRRYGG
ncbi:MAG: IS21 family transposase [Acidobacteria bacterium]|nr:IS21 family transposase [Acidobacteriota bacterium]